MKKKQIVELITIFKKEQCTSSNEIKLFDLLSSFATSDFFHAKGDNDEISYFEFIAQKTLLRESFFFKTPLNLTTQETMATFYHEWKFERGFTFMGTPFKDIPPEKRIFIGHKYENVDEILAFMKYQKQCGKNIFQNPETDEVFSNDDILKIKTHPICKIFCDTYEAEKTYLESLEFPPEFYSLLENYLSVLYEIGQSNSQQWEFSSEEKMLRCEEAKSNFFKTLQTTYGSSLDDLLLKNISVSLRGSTSNATVGFGIIAQGISPYDCIITQQIYLWSLLKIKNPSIEIPEKLKTHPQATIFNLGDIKTTDDDIFNWVRTL